MNFNLKTKFLLLLSSVLIISCNLDEMYESENWEDVNEPYDPVLNVKAVIRLDTLLFYDESMEECEICEDGDTIKINYGLSSVEVYSTMGLSEISELVVGSDTLPIWYECMDEWVDWGEDPQNCNEWYIINIYEPASIIKDAEVIITDIESGIEYEFNYIQNEILYLNTVFGSFNSEIEVHHYKDTSNQFIPKPNTRYSLNINYDGYDPVVGELITPSIPELNTNLQDTLDVNIAYEIHWQTIPDSGFIQGYINSEKNFDEEFDEDMSNFCGGEFQWFGDLSDSLYTVNPQFIEESYYCSDEPTKILIKLVAMDNNFYDYFIIGGGEKFENFLLGGQGTSGNSMGIQGGYGVFGAIASDKLIRIITP